MKKLVLGAILLFLTMSSFGQDSEYLEAFQKKWENSKNYLIEVAEAMPEEEYAFKPTEREMTFAQQLDHINRNMNWINSDYLSKEKLDTAEFPRAKAEIIETISQSFDRVSETMQHISEKDLQHKTDFFAGEMSLLQMLNLMQDHVTHHRGQLIVYLNLKGIEPPAYLGW
ncbi:DinB family protein [Gramella sp. AN32]|uniref:DinB family protein n=1 Tax=Christiangramia antarctica TaxID=2058158 RepID=A0ABW5X189_9FLAO|nr:DinB family protein [Gramella sp. AN32]MCM4155072.1 DinB family protein [Gramella sp. AN32]